MVMPDCSLLVTTFSRHSWLLQRTATSVTSIGPSLMGTVRSALAGFMPMLARAVFPRTSRRLLTAADLNRAAAAADHLDPRPCRIRNRARSRRRPWGGRGVAAADCLGAGLRDKAPVAATVVIDATRDVTGEIVTRFI